MFKDFKEFAFAGNLIDMAVGIIIGGAFATVIKSLVDNVFMPVLGKVTGGINFSNMYANLGEAKFATYKEALEAGAPVIGYGQFIQDLISFVILALVVFIVIKKAVGGQKKAEAEAPPAPSDEAVLLAEIRDSLKK